MSLFRLVLRSLSSHPVRSALTLLFATLALFTFVFLRSALTTLESAVEAAATNRLAVQSATSLFVYMPESYRAKIEAVEGVESVGPWNWFGGYYQDKKNRFAQFAADIPVMLEQYPEFVIDPEQEKALLEGGQGALVGEETAAQYGWTIGQTVPIIATIYARKKDDAWPFILRATYRSSSPNFDEKTMFFHWAYFSERRKEARKGGDFGEQDVGVWFVKVKDGSDPARVIDAIDRLFENGPQKTRTQTEAQFQAQFATMLGNLPVFLGSIAGAVLFAILFSILNTAQMTARERARDVGILKALGFRDGVAGRLLLVESMLLVGLGGLLGVALAWVSQAPFRALFALFLPNYHVAPETTVLGVGIALGIGFLGGLVPAWRLGRLKTVDVLRQEA